MKWPSACFVSVAVGCSAPQSSPPPPAKKPVAAEFSFAGIDGARVDAPTVRGRVTVILFATTFDISSQEQARRLEDLYRTHAPRINAVLVVLEPAKNIELVRSFREVLGLTYLVAMADPLSLSGDGAFGGVTSVPTWIVLDREGRPGLFVGGQVSPSQLVEMVDRAW